MVETIVAHKSLDVVVLSSLIPFDNRFSHVPIAVSHLLLAFQSFLSLDLPVRESHRLPAGSDSVSLVGESSLDEYWGSVDAPRVVVSR